MRTLAGVVGAFQIGVQGHARNSKSPSLTAVSLPFSGSRKPADSNVEAKNAHTHSPTRSRWTDRGKTAGAQAHECAPTKDVFSVATKAITGPTTQRGMEHLKSVEIVGVMRISMLEPIGGIRDLVGFYKCSFRRGSRILHAHC